MKNYFIYICVLVLSFDLAADTTVSSKSKKVDQKSEVKIEKNTSNLKEKNGWELGLGYYQLNNEFDGGGSESLNGFSLIGSKDFKLSERVFTKTTLAKSIASNKETKSEFNTDSDYSHYGISQNLAYTVEVSGIHMKPYISYGFGKGDFVQTTDGLDATAQDILGIKSYKTKAIYTTQVSTIGLQVILDNGLVPFLAFETTNITFKRVKTSTVKSGSKDTVSISYDLEDTVSRAFVAGAAYAF